MYNKYQEAINLRPTQIKAFKELEKAIKKCQRENVLFCFNSEFDSLGAMDGNQISHIGEGAGPDPDNTCLSMLSYPLIEFEMSVSNGMLHQHVVLK